MLSDRTFNLENPVTGAGAGRCRAVAGFALDRSLPDPALKTHNSPFGLRQCVSPLRGHSGPGAAVPSHSATRPPVTAPPHPCSVLCPAEGWRGGEVASGGPQGARWSSAASGPRSLDGYRGLEQAQGTRR